MARDLIFYTNPMSRGRIVRWMLEEVGVPYETQWLEYGTTMKSPEYLAVNPMGKVPAIRHGDTVVTEVAAICLYLADAFPDAALAPPPHDRGAYYRWMLFAAGPVEAAVTNKSLGFEPSADQEAMAGYGNLSRVLDTLEKALTGRQYMAGEAFSAADVYLGSQIGWGMQFGTMDERPVFEDYFGRLKERPAHIRATELDDAAMPQAQG